MANRQWGNPLFAGDTTWFGVPASAPTFSPAAGSYSSAQTVTLSCATSGVAIFYTTDGSTPTPLSQRYLGPFSVSANETINAIAIAPGFFPSAVTSATYLFISFAGATLPGFTPGVAYSQNVAGHVTGGVPPFTFSLVTETSLNTWFVDSLGNITGTPGGVDLVTETGVFLVTDTGDRKSVV